MNCVLFSQFWCIRLSSAWSQWDLWESEVTADSRDPIVVSSEPCYQRYLHLVSSVFRIRIFLLGAFVNLNIQLQPTIVLPLYLFGFLLIGIITSFLVYWSRVVIFCSLPSWSFVRAAGHEGISPWQPFYLRAYCFALFASLCCNVVFRVNLLRISLTYFQFASEYSTSSISCHHKVVRALWLLLLRLIRFYVRARIKVL